MPPECMSIWEPSTALAITEHSRCHPGRPGPQGDGHEGSPGFDDFQSAKSALDLVFAFTERAPEEPMVQIGSRETALLMLSLPSPSARKSSLFLLHGSIFAYS
jgi:hypothetical protein